MTYVYCENYKGGINNLWVARDGKTDLIATSTVSKKKAIGLLHRTMRKFDNKKERGNLHE